MFLVYIFIIYLLLSIVNNYIVWLIIELIFLYFLLIILNYEVKRVGLIIYFFFQSVMSLFLFIRIVYFWDKIIFILLIAKLGIFPFFYWIVVVSLKVGLWGNVFVLGLQKISVFWLIWLLLNVKFRFLYFCVYLRVFFVIFSLFYVVDLWLLLVYSSIANSGILLLRVRGSRYIYRFILYLCVIIIIIFLLRSRVRYNELLLFVFFFLVIPPFILFFIKFYIIISLEFMIKLGFIIFIFDVLVLLYYFSLIFMKFILVEVRVLIYFINLLILVLILIIRNCVAMIIFYKSQRYWDFIFYYWSMIWVFRCKN